MKVYEWVEWVGKVIVVFSDLFFFFVEDREYWIEIVCGVCGLCDCVVVSNWCYELVVVWFVFFINIIG